jgi:hypothetical protein
VLSSKQEQMNPEFALRFLKQDFIDNAVTGDQPEFAAALKLLNQQTNIPLNANQNFLFRGYTTPIHYLSQLDAYEFGERAAQLIEAMYKHCGIPTNRHPLSQYQYRSPLWITADDDNFHVFQTLIEECNATFDVDDNRTGYPCILHRLASKGDTAIRYLTLLAKHPEIPLNPNLLYMNGETALHQAVTHINPSPAVVRLLINSFGADPLIPNKNGLLPLDYLNLASDGQVTANYLKTERLLTHTERTTAVLMGTHLRSRNRESELRHLDKDLAALVISFLADD